MPLRMLLAHLQQHRTEMNEVQNNDGRQLNQGASESVAHSNALTNAINVGGIPIMNTVSGTHTASTSSGHTGSVKEQFSIGNLGLIAGLNSEGIGTGFGVNRKPGEFGLHFGSLNFGVNNHASANSQTQTIAASSATGTGATSTSQTDAHTNSHILGNAVTVQNTVSSSHAHSSTLSGTTSAIAGAASTATQNTQASNPIQYQEYQQQPGNPQPGITQQTGSQQPTVEMKVIIPQPGYQPNPQPGAQQGSSQQPGYQSIGMEYISIESCEVL